jgi:thioredoxin reductase (NADPH)
MPDVRQSEEAVIVGAGPIGLACAISAKRHGVDPLVIDAGALVNSIVHYPVAMTFFTTPDLLEIGGHPFASAGQKPTREEALKYYRGVARAEALRVRTYAGLAGAVAVPGGIRCELQSSRGAGRLECQRLILATGYYDHFNPLDVPGEDLPHVSHRFDEAHRSYGLDVVVVGGKNSAVEAALELYRAGARVTLVYRREALRPSVKYWLKPDIENRIKAGDIQARFSADVLRIEDRTVVVRQAGLGEERLPADRVYALTGFHPDFDLFRSIGIELDPETARPRINPDTLETNVPGISMAGSITAGRAISEVFIENGRFDGERIFGGGGAKPPVSAGVGGTG